MRRLRSSWTKVLTQLGFRHPRKQRKRTHIYRRSSRLESLEDRRLLAIDDWRKVLDVAPPSFAAGHFTLNSTDWAGKANGGRVMASGYAMGIDQKVLTRTSAVFNRASSGRFALISQAG